MRFKSVVTWDGEVHPEWARACRGNWLAGDEIWRQFPLETCWIDAEIEDDDASRIFVIGSGDWKTDFGSYRLSEVAAQQYDIDDKRKHRSRIVAMQQAIEAGLQLGRPILISSSGEGPFVIMDGNHRLVAHHRAGKLGGLPVYVGLHHRIPRVVIWFSAAVRE